MQYNGQNSNEFRYRWNNYKDNNRKSLRVEDHKQADFFAHFQTAGHSGFIDDTEIRFIDKTDPSDPSRREDFWIDTLKTRYPQGLKIILTHTIIYCFCSFTSFHCIYVNFFFFNLQVIFIFIFICCTSFV